MPTPQFRFGMPAAGSHNHRPSLLLQINLQVPVDSPMVSLTRNSIRFNADKLNLQLFAVQQARAVFFPFWATFDCFPLGQSPCP